MAKICIIRHFHFPQETHVYRDARALVKRGHQVDVLCLKSADQPALEKVDGICVYRLSGKHERQGGARYLLEYLAFVLLVFFKLTGLYLRKRYDVIEVDTLPDFLVFSTLVPKIMGAKIVLYLFEATPEMFAYKYNLPGKHPLLWFFARIEQAAIRFADQAITVSEIVKGLFVARGACAEKIAVILNVPDENVFCSEKTLTKIRNATEFTLIYQGTLTEVYGVDVAIRSIARLKHKIPGLKFRIAGDGEQISYLKELVNRLQVEDIVNFTGWITQTSLVNLITSADAGVIPILGGYGDIMVPNKLFEYIALKKPVICSSLRAIHYYFDEASLQFFPAGDDEQLANNILELYEHPKMGESMAKKALEIYNKYRWEKSSVVYCDVLAGEYNS